LRIRIIEGGDAALAVAVEQDRTCGVGSVMGDAGRADGDGVGQVESFVIKDTRVFCPRRPMVP